MESKHIAGYTGYIPGEKWKFGSRSDSEPPPRNRGTVESEPPQRPPSKRMTRSAKMRMFESEVVRGADSSTQFPVQTNEMAIQADVENNTNIEEFTNQAKPTEGRRSRPTSRSNGRPPLDGRIVNNHAPSVLFMKEDPFKGLNGNYNAGKRAGRFYENSDNVKLSKSFYDSIPAAGYSGHIPGLKTAVGKPYGQVVRELKEQSA